MRPSRFRPSRFRPESQLSAGVFQITSHRDHRRFRASVGEDIGLQGDTTTSGGFVRRIHGYAPAQRVCQLIDREGVRGYGRCESHRIFSRASPETMQNASPRARLSSVMTSITSAMSAAFFPGELRNTSMGLMPKPRKNCK